MEIVKYPNKILTTKCPPYEHLFFFEDHKIAVEMVGLMLADKNCVGIAANQVGIAKRFFVMRQPAGNRMCFDPVILKHGRDIEILSEGCMSLPGLRVPVPRWRIVTVEYTNDKKNRVTLTLKGLEARIFQHELDHLNGLMIIKTDDDQ